MTTDIKELVKRLTATRTQRDLNWNDVTYPINPDGEEAALALEVLAGEVATLNASLGQAETERDEFADERDRLKETITTAVQFNEGLAAERDRLKAALDALSAVRGDLPEKVSEQWLYEGVRHWHRNCDWDEPRDGSPLDRGDGATVAKLINMIPRKALGDAS